MNGGSSRRTFFKQVLSLSAFGAASAISFRRRGKSVGVDIGPEEAQAMNHPDYASAVAEGEVKIEYMGMSCFLITTGAGPRIITDPVQEDSQILHPELRKEPAEIMGITFRGVSTRHLE